MTFERWWEARTTGNMKTLHPGDIAREAWAAALEDANVADLVEALQAAASSLEAVANPEVWLPYEPEERRHEMRAYAANRALSARAALARPPREETP